MPHSQYAFAGHLDGRRDDTGTSQISHGQLQEALADGQRHADLFYYRLFETTPEVRSLFPRDLIAQKKKFITMLAAMVTNLNEFGKIAPVVEDLGMRHADYGVVAKHYEPFGAALLWALGECLRGDFTPPVRTAWTEAYKTLAGIMTRAAANLPPPTIAC